MVGSVRVCVCVCVCVFVCVCVRVRVRARVRVCAHVHLFVTRLSNACIMRVYHPHFILILEGKRCSRV